MSNIGFYILYGIIRLISLLPFCILYIISDFFYFIIYHISGYRRKVVYDNLIHAFPEKSEKEIKKIAKGFYHHFCDFIIESIKTIDLSLSQLNKRFRYKNMEIFENYYRQGESIVLTSGHYGNWEWLIAFQTKVRHKFLAIYKPLQNKKFDILIKKIREKYAGIAEMVSMNDIYKTVIENEKKDQKIITWFLCDQTPPRNYPLWINFLNRETPFYSGPEKIAKKFNHVVVFMDIQKVRRGYYEVEFTELFSNPAGITDNKITEKQVRTLEKIIRERPEYWLWSHRRWKHKKENL